MGRVILITSGKGGVGKSTAAVGLSFALASLGKRTLLIDCDCGLGSLDLLTFRRENNVFNLADVLSDTVDLARAAVKCRDGVDLLCAPKKPLSDGSAEMIPEFIARVRDDYDLIFIDSPAGISAFTSLLARVSDNALIVATPDEVSVKAACSAAEALSNEGIVSPRLIVNRFQYKAVKKRKLLNIDEVIDKSCARLIGIVPEDKNVVFSSVTGRTPPPDCPSSLAFHRIALRLTGADVPLIPRQLK